jgi:hypothetical protein
MCLFDSVSNAVQRYVLHASISPSLSTACYDPFHPRDRNVPHPRTFLVVLWRSRFLRLVTWLQPAHPTLTARLARHRNRTAQLLRKNQVLPQASIAEAVQTTVNMPPHGLYKVPGNHLYPSSQHAVRPIFNTMDFQDDEPPGGKEKMVIDEAAQMVADMGAAPRKESIKKKRMHSLSTTIAQAGDRTATPTSVDEEIATFSTDGKRKKKHKDRVESGELSAKKRKRNSEIQAASSPLMRNDYSNDSLVTDAVVPKPSKHGNGAGYGLSQNILQVPELKPSLKKTKSTRASEATLHEQTGDNSIELVGDGSKKKKSKHNKRHESLQTFDASAQSVPGLQEGAANTGSPYATMPRKTPVPLPQKVSSMSTTATAIKEPAKQRGATDVLVTETPPSHTSRSVISPWETPIPFNVPKALGVSKEGKKSKTSQRVHVSSTIANDGGSRTTAPGTLSQAGRNISSIRSSPSLTTTNLLRYTEPLNDEPKPRPRAWGGSLSSASSMSIKDAFARMSKPSTNSSDPFLSRTPRPPKPVKETSLEAFTSALQTFQSTVNFESEHTDLVRHLTLRFTTASAGPLPCLKQATGCDAAKEAGLAILRTDPTDTSITSSGRGSAFDRSVSANLSAETFLHHAILSRIPVPTGNLEGVYTLYCPSYAMHHVDRYGFGQRMLAISRPQGFNSNTFTARLMLPPRPMGYTTLAFKLSAHASFRPATLTTAAEGYKMSLVALGNGHILLRMDLGLLLTGRGAGPQGESVEMEFRGVREKDGQGEGAVMFGAVEEGVRKSVEGKEGKEKESPSKKKRGRPSNAELSRRAREKEEAGSGV